jgi:threonine dehydratase
MPPLPTLDDVLAASRRLTGVVRRTPVLPFDALAHQVHAASVLLKCENLQLAGAFKYRGANNAILALTEQATATPITAVVTHSSGNHGAAVALAARRLGLTAHVVVPTTVSPAKLRLIENAGAIVHTCPPTVAAREAAVAAIQAQTGAPSVHPYDDNQVIAGQATATVELLEQAPDTQIILAPVSGGGLLAGTALAAHAGLALRAINPKVAVYGAEPLLADDAARSLHTRQLCPGSPTASQTIADGLRAQLSARTFAIIQAGVTDILTVPEADLIAAMRFTWDHTKMLIEPSCAVAVAAVQLHPHLFAHKHIAIIITGGNVDLEAKLPWQ